MLKYTFVATLCFSLFAVNHAVNAMPPETPKESAQPNLLVQDVPSTVPVVPKDLDTYVQLFRSDSLSMHVGGLLQIQGAFFVDDQASIQNHDAADTEGFRIRRARLAFGGHLFKNFSYYLGIDLKDTVAAAIGGDKGSEILDAKLTWNRYRWAQISLGVDKVPFSQFALTSAAQLTLIERPLTVSLLAPERRVGLTVLGDLWQRNHTTVRYAAAVVNGSDGITSGNQLAGIAAGGYLQAAYARKTGECQEELGGALGGAYLYEDGAAVNKQRLAAHAILHGWLARLTGEFIWELAKPDTQPSAAGGEIGDVSRWGAIGELSLYVWRRYIQLAGRYEYLNDNDQLPTYGRQQLYGGGANFYLYEHHLKLQINYMRRHELVGAPVSNDMAFAQVQAMF